MSSGGQVAGGVLGAVAGFLIGGPAASLKGALYGAQIGMTIGGYLDPPKGPVQEGPRLSDLTVQTSTYGAVIPRGYGTFPVVGNVFWLENNALKETITKKKSGGKGGGSKTTTKTYSYSATFAVGLLDCTDGTPIAGVRRIWIGGRLWYDAGATDLATIIASNQVTGAFTLHTGSALQLADPRMQATLGVANTPAYRGLAYIVFNDLPLAAYSNSLVGAQIKVEVVRVQSPAGLTIIDSVVSEYSSPVTNPAFAAKPHYLSLDLVRVYVPNWDNNYPASSTYSVYDSRLGAFSFTKTIAVPGTEVPLNGTSDNPDRYMYGHTQMFPLSTWGEVNDGNGTFYEQGDVLIFTGTTTLRVRYKLGPEIVIALPTENWAGCTDGSFVYILGNSAIRKYDTSLNLLGSLTVTLNNLGGGMRLCADAGLIYWCKPYGSTLWAIRDDLTGGEINVGTVPTFTGTGSLNNIEFRMFGNLMVRSQSNITSKTLFRHIIQTDKPAYGTTTLSSVVSAECLKSKLLTAGDINVTALTQVVKGYRLGNVAAIRAGLEPLQAAWPFDVLQSGYTIKFKVRGSSSVTTVPATDLDARSAGETPGVSITNTREMDSVLPRRVTLSYLDTAREYDNGEQYAERLNTGSINIRSIDLAIALTSAEAAAMAEVLLYLYWMERYDLSFSLPPTYSALEPGDTITVNVAEATYTLRLTAITYTQDGRLECTARYNSSAVYTAAALGVVGQSTGVALTLTGDSLTEFLDVPTLGDSLDLAGYPVAMTGYLAGWPGGSVYRSDDGGQTWTDMQAFAPPGAVIGQALNSIGAPPSLLMDKGSLLSVSLYQGTLSSVSELAIFSGANYFAYGAAGRWEIIAAQTCTLQGDGSYVLQDFLRGQKGTEWASGLHAAGDKLIELDSSLAFVTASIDTIGLAKIYRGVTDGRSLDTVSDQSFTYRGVNLRPLSPVYLNGNRHPSTNDWTLTWIRRTRVGDAWRDLVDASLGEASELYDVEIYSSGAYTTLKRTLSALTGQTAAYTSAQQVTDFGSNQATLYVKIYQLSATVGRGYPLTTSITR
ncbi:phage tail protein [Propionivibrio sp.]|uniref:phage tail protein n=1 Tax=Propionivibrio sp. TaxID=2212460 RepID=UPI0025FF6BBB|nr:phage tail protein [Propionivibrio sp.]MBK8745590.1 hypothetical protein [Propionivibrio sp.]